MGGTRGRGRVQRKRGQGLGDLRQLSDPQMHFPFVGPAKENEKHKVMGSP